MNRDTYQLLELRRSIEYRERLEKDYAFFVREAWPIVEGNRPLLWNWHIDVIGEYLTAFSNHEFRRLVINIPFRCMKSVLCSVMYHPWRWATDPNHSFLGISYDEKLALRDAIRARNIIMSDWYGDLWGENVIISSDVNKGVFYQNTAGGFRMALGMESGGTGHGGDTQMFDDPHDADDLGDNRRRATIERFDTKWASRLQDPDKSQQLLVMQRLHHEDLSGHVLNHNIEGWESLILPMEYEPKRYVSAVGPLGEDPRTEPGELLWKERFTETVVDRYKGRLGEYATAGQFQQRPAPQGGGILKTKWWQEWPEGTPLPNIEYVIQVYDTAFTETEMKTNSQSARTTWGIFLHEQTHKFNLLLLERWSDWVGFPELRKKVLEDYVDWLPDRVIIEKKASGQSLIQELRQSKIPMHGQVPVETIKADRDKTVRAHRISPILERGFVWYPKRKWAAEVIRQCELFPNGELDDLFDTVVHALTYFRDRYLLNLDDVPDIQTNSSYKPKRAPYG